MFSLTWLDRFQICSLSSCNDMTFPFTLYVPSTLGFLKAVRYIVAILSVTVVESCVEALHCLVVVAVATSDERQLLLFL